MSLNFTKLAFLKAAFPLLHHSIGLTTFHFFLTAIHTCSWPKSLWMRWTRGSKIGEWTCKWRKGDSDQTFFSQVSFSSLLSSQWCLIKTMDKYFRYESSVCWRRMALPKNWRRSLQECQALHKVNDKKWFFSKWTVNIWLFTRCVFTTVDPKTGEARRDREPLKTLRTFRFDPSLGLCRPFFLISLCLWSHTF